MLYHVYIWLSQITEAGADLFCSIEAENADEALEEAMKLFRVSSALYAWVAPDDVNKPSLERSPVYGRWSGGSA